MPQCAPQDELVPSWSKISIRPGRPRKLFADTSKKSNRRKTGHCRELAAPNMLTFAAKISHKESGQIYAAKVMNALITTTLGTKFLSYKKFSILLTEVKKK
jgi:hypothetical protein